MQMNLWVDIDISHQIPKAMCHLQEIDFPLEVRKKNIIRATDNTVTWRENVFSFTGYFEAENTQPLVRKELIEIPAPNRS